MISSTTINTSSSSRHTVYNILIWNFNIDRIINLLSHSARALIKCLCLWNCTRKPSSTYPSDNLPDLLCLQRDQLPVHPVQEDPDPYMFLLSSKLCSVFDIGSENISVEICGIEYFSAIFLSLCSFSCSWAPNMIIFITLSSI